MIPPHEADQISRVNTRWDQPVTIRLQTAGDGPGRALQEFAGELAGLASNLRIRRENVDPPVESALLVDKTIYFRSPPTGTELPPFLEMLTTLSKRKSAGNRAPAPQTTAIDMPAELKLYVSAACPHCPLMVRRLFPMALYNRNIRLTIMDAARFPQDAEKDAVNAVPTLILDGRFRWTGPVAAAELAAVIQKRDPAALGLDSLVALIENGDAYRLAQWMQDAEAVFPVFLDLLCHEAFSIRLGAMAAFEELADGSPYLAARLIEPLLERYPGAPDTIKGDIIYMLGEAADASILHRLRSLADASDNPEIKEAAADAAARIRER